MIPAYRNLKDLNTDFPDEASCFRYLEEIRWNGKPRSPFDENAEIRKEKEFNYFCKSTGKTFNVRTNTFFANKKLPLHKYFRIIWFFMQMPDLPSTRGADLTGVSQKTVWSVKKQLKALLIDPPVHSNGKENN